MMFGKDKAENIYGAWEERGVIGSRIEIDRKKVTVLWRGAPVLESAYKTKTEGERTTILLNATGMRYQGDSSDYAQVAELYVEGEKLFFAEDFPISGRSQSTLTKTENNRYGDYEIVTDRYAGELAGVWSDENGWFRLIFRGNKLGIDRCETRYVVLRRKYDNAILIHDEDPSKDMIGGLTNIQYAGVLRATIPVCDAPSTVIELKKVK